MPPCLRWLLLSLCFTGAAVAQSTERPPADPADVESIDAIIKASYEVISGPAGEERNWDRERSLFHPESRHIPTFPGPDGSHQAQVLTVEDFIERSGPYLTTNGFFEYEIAREVHRYGNIAQVFSTYAWRQTEEGPVGGRGINSFQLYYDGTRWWIVSILWMQESPQHPIPAEFLPADG